MLPLFAELSGKKIGMEHVETVLRYMSHIRGVELEGDGGEARAGV